MTQDIKPLIESSTYKSYKSYENTKDVEDIMDNVPHSIQAPYEREMIFQSQVDDSKGGVKRQIVTMVRIKVNGKEYLLWHENWYAKDWKNADIDPITETIQGVHKEVDIVPQIDERNRKIGSQYKGSHDVYEREFSKAEVDKLLSETGTDKDSVKYKVKTPTRRGEPNYDQFVNTTWNQAQDILLQDGGFELDYVESLKDKQTTKK